jgi:hypothetical protein
MTPGHCRRARHGNHPEGSNLNTTNEYKQWILSTKQCPLAPVKPAATPFNTSLRVLARPCSEVKEINATGNNITG